MHRGSGPSLQPVHREARGPCHHQDRWRIAGEPRLRKWQPARDGSRLHLRNRHRRPTRQAAYCAPFVTLVHSHLGLEWGATAAERLYEEEDGGDGAGAEHQRHFNPKQANIIVCDEDPIVSLVEEVRLSPEDIRGLGEDGLGEKILAGLLHPAGLLSCLRDQGVSADQLRSRRRGAGGGAIPGADLDPRCRRRRFGARCQFRTSARAALSHWSGLRMSWRACVKGRPTR